MLSISFSSRFHIHRTVIVRCAPGIASFTPSIQRNAQTHTLIIMITNNNNINSFEWNATKFSIESHLNWLAADYQSFGNWPSSLWPSEATELSLSLYTMLLSTFMLLFCWHFSIEFYLPPHLIFKHTLLLLLTLFYCESKLRAECEPTAADDWWRFIHKFVRLNFISGAMRLELGWSCSFVAIFVHRCSAWLTLVRGREIRSAKVFARSFVRCSGCLFSL